MACRAAASTSRSGVAFAGPGSADPRESALGAFAPRRNAGPRPRPKSCCRRPRPGSLGGPRPRPKPRPLPRDLD
eukprot:13937493-Alexandrium_andersonii.AAC.1